MANFNTYEKNGEQFWPTGPNALAIVAIHFTDFLSKNEIRLKTFFFNSETIKNLFRDISSIVVSGERRTATVDECPGPGSGRS
mgnify:CR=1 FL=1